MSLFIKKCKHCEKVKHFQEWKPMPVELQYAINAGDIAVSDVVCEQCSNGASNKLLPVG